MDKRKIGEEKKIKQRELLTMEEICINCACSTPVSYENCFCFFRRSCGKENTEVTSRLGVVGGLVTKQRVRNDFWVIRYDCQFVGYTEVL